jgi:hypothetical protein
MSENIEYPNGAPCWVETRQPDPSSASRFYGELFGWKFTDPDPKADVTADPLLEGRIEDRLVAGIYAAGPQVPVAVWTTYVRVESVEATVVAQATEAGGGLLAGEAERQRALISDPAGVVIGVQEAGAGSEVELVDEPGTWTMSVLHTPDPEGAEVFYGALFGWILEPVAGAPFSCWRLPGYLGGEPGQPMPRDVVAVMSPTDHAGEVPPHWAVNFRVEDADASAAQALASGGEVLMPPVDGGGLRSAVIADPRQGVVAISAPAQA